MRSWKHRGSAPGAVLIVALATVILTLTWSSPSNAGEKVPFFSDCELCLYVSGFHGLTSPEACDTEEERQENQDCATCGSHGCHDDAVEGTCGTHGHKDCPAIPAPEPVADAIAAGDTATLGDLLMHPSIRLNVDRGAVQITDCSGDVVAHFPLSRALVDALASDGR